MKLSDNSTKTYKGNYFTYHINSVADPWETPRGPVPLIRHDGPQNLFRDCPPPPYLKI